jgi:hypothetical protein
MMRRDFAANAGAFIAAILFGGSVVAVRVAVQDIPPLTLAILRFGQGSFLTALSAHLGAGSATGCGVMFPTLSSSELFFHRLPGDLST